MSSLYIDQPVGVGFSHGTTEVGTSEAAAADTWTVRICGSSINTLASAHSILQFLQIFFKDYKFTRFAHHPFALWTESSVYFFLSIVIL
jgi:hypothetical protein